MGTQITREQDLQNLVVYLSANEQTKWRVPLSVMFSLLAIIIFTMVIHWDQLAHLNSTLVWIILGLFLSLLGVGIGVGIWRGYGKVPVLIVNHDGFLIGIPGTMNRSHVPWSELEAIYAEKKKSSSYTRQSALSFQLRNLQGFRSGLNWPARLFLSAKDSSTEAPIHLWQKSFDLPIEDLLGQIAERFAHELRHYEIRLSHEDPLEERDARQEFVIYQNRQTLALFQIVCWAIPLFLFFIMGIFLVEKAHYTGNVSYEDFLEFLIVIGATTLLFGSCALLFLYVLVKPRAMLTINSQGIFQGDSSKRSGIFIAWPEIKSVYISYYQSQKFLCIHFKDPERSFTRYGRPTRFTLRINTSTIGAPICLAQRFLEDPLEDILRQIATLYANELSRYEIELRSRL